MLGLETAPDEWEATLAEHAESGDFIVQEYVPIPEEMFPTIEDGHVQMRLKRFNINPYCLGGRYVGMMTRISDQAVINVAAGGGILPSVVGRHKRKLLLEEDEEDVPARVTPGREEPWRSGESRASRRSPCSAAGPWAAASPVTWRGPGFASRWSTPRPTCPDRPRAAVRAHPRPRGGGPAPPDATDRTAHIETPADMEAAVAGVDLVIEAVPEDAALKDEVLRRCAAAAPVEAIIASNTSSLPIEGLAASVSEPGPVPRRALVQPAGVDARASRSSPHRAPPATTVDRAIAFLRAVGKRPAEVADRAGFVANRLQLALLREALAIVEEGQRRRDDLDEVVRSTFGSGCRSSARSRSPTWRGSTSTRACSRRSSATSARSSRRRRSCARTWRPGGSARRAGRASAPGATDEREALLLERDRRYAALAKLLTELDAGDA